MSIKVELVGADELERAIKRLGDDASRVLAAAFEAAAVVLVEAIKPNAPGDQIAHDVIEQTPARVEVDVGPTREAWHYRFFETGVQPHEVTPTTARALRIGDRFAARATPGGFAARPFMRPAIDENQSQVEAAAGEVLREAIEVER